MEKVLLLNPPGKKKYIRDYFCSKISKTGFYPNPVDLLMLSGILSKDFDVKLLDAIVNKKNINKTLIEIKKIKPDYIISLVGSVSFKEDINFLKKISNYAPLIVIGDIFLEDYVNKMKKYNFIEAILFDFTTNDVVNYIKRNYKKIKNMVYRKNNKIIVAPKIPIKGQFKIPMPRYDIFLKYNYTYPFIKGYPMATVLTDYGCPYKCSFCVMPSLGFKYRPIDDIIKDLKYLRKLGVRDIYFSDQTFGVIKKRNIELCKKIIRNKLNLRWFCFSRVNTVDYKVLKLMKEAGCHTIMFGVESANEELLRKYNKSYTLDQVKTTFKNAKKLDIRVMGTFIIGLPEEDINSCLSTFKFAKELDCDFASFNFAVPRMNTKLRKEAINKHLFDKNIDVMDQSGSFISMPTTKLSKLDLKKLRKKAIIGFYLRPKYILKRLKNLDSYFEFKNHIKEAFGMIKNYLWGK